MNADRDGTVMGNYMRIRFGCAASYVGRDRDGAWAPTVLSVGLPFQDAERVR